MQSSGIAKTGPKHKKEKFITVNCTGCGIEFSVYKHRYEKHSKNRRFFHNKVCFQKYVDFKGSDFLNRRKNPDKTKTVNCTGCGITFSMWKSRYEIPRKNKNIFYHSLECYYKKLHSESIQYFVQVNCTGCNIPMKIYKKRYENSKSKTFFHNRKCFVNSNEKYQKTTSAKKISIRNIYVNNYRCGHCEKFIKKTDALIHTTPTGRKYPVCPDPRCGKYALQIRPRRTVYKKKLKEGLELKKQLQQKQKQIPIPPIQNLK